MEEYFGIKYEFDKNSIHNNIAEHIREEKAGYICVADGNILTMVHQSPTYRNEINKSIFSICDSSWVPIFIKWIYGRSYQHYCGNDIFNDIISSKKYRMIFLGTSQNTLDALQNNLQSKNPDVANMLFRELPYCNVEDFDYPTIAQDIQNDGADIIWIALGAPKQEKFMHHLLPHLKKGVAIAVGAAFNFNSGAENAPNRAPAWMRRCHLEFLHRIFAEPKKQIKRCGNILLTLPQILYKEIKKKRGIVTTHD